MNEIKEFSPEVCEELGYYVYRLIDPRNGQTFYVGKGKNNRIFAHAKCALKETESVDYDPDVDDESNLKYKTIRDIKDAGLDIVYIIQKYGLSNRDALIVESALIDAYSLRQLTNKIKGFSTSEPTNALTLQRDFAAEEYVDDPNNPRYMIIKTKDFWLNQRKDRYECTRSAWRVSREKAKKYPYVLSVTRGIVREVYKVDEWYESDREGRSEFEGHIAEDEVRSIFINKRIPEEYRKKGMASSFLYCKY